ncbi:MAG: ABC transporter ATP-binding protein [Mycobacteriales bacterium]
MTLDLDRLGRLPGPPEPSYGSGADIVCDNVVKIYQTGGVEVVALQGLDLLVEPGELMAIVGASGSGKSTLLNILSGLDTLTAGTARVGNFDLVGLSSAERTRYRRQQIGFIWQQVGRNHLPHLTAAENVELPMSLAGIPRRHRRTRVHDLLELLGVANRADHRPERMSGGEQQRVAIAIALAGEPACLFADEPTGELDTRTSHEVFTALRSASTDLGVTIVVVTHDPMVATQVDRTVAMRDGRTSTETFRRAQDHEGEMRFVAEEFAVLDRAGRVQLPREYLDALELQRRVRLALEPDHIGIWRDGANDA